MLEPTCQSIVEIFTSLLAARCCCCSGELCCYRSTDWNSIGNWLTGWVSDLLRKEMLLLAGRTTTNAATVEELFTGLRRDPGFMLTVEIVMLLLE